MIWATIYLSSLVCTQALLIWDLFFEHFRLPSKETIGLLFLFSWIPGLNTIFAFTGIGYRIYKFSKGESRYE